MGAGCWYTHPNTSELACWIRFTPYYKHEEDAKAEGEEPLDEETYWGDQWHEMEETIGLVMAELNYYQKDAWEWYNNLAQVKFETTHACDGLILYLTCRDDSMVNLFNRNFDGMERKILAKFHNDHGYEIRRAAGNAWQSCEIKFNKDGSYV